MDTVASHRTLATESLNLWQGKQFEGCLRVLEHLQKLNPQDPKVLHNVAIAKFCKNGCRDTEEILKSLLDVKAAMERNDRWGPDDKSENAAYLRTAELAVVSLNMAIIRFQQREIKEVLSLLEPLFARIGPLDDGTAFRVCLLLLDVYIPRKDFEKAKNVVGFLGKTYGSLFKPDERDGEHLMDGEKEFMGSKFGGVGHMGDSSSSNTDESEEPCADSWPLALPALSKMGVVPLQLGTKNGDSRQDKDKAGSMELKVVIHIYRAKLLFAMKDLKLVKREVKCILAVVPTSIPALFLKAQLHYLRGNMKKAAKILSRCVEGTIEPSIVRVAALCNMGAIYHQMGKHNSACLCFSNALKQNGDLNSAGEHVLDISVPDPSTMHEQRLQLLYNAGLQHLLLKRYTLALDCFRDVAVLMFDKPILWLRMAECCLGIHQDGEADKASAGETAEGSREPFLAEVVGESGSHRLLLLPEATAAASHGIGVLSEAITYLQNACFLLEQQERMLAGEANKADEQRNAFEATNGHTGSGSPSQDVAHIRQLALCKLAYVHLLLEQPERALAALEPIMQAHWMDRQIALMVNCYSSEALCLMDKPSEAANQLGMFMAGLEDDENETPQLGMAQDENGNTAEDNGMHAAGQQHPDLSGPNASATLYVNLASVYATQGELLEAQQCAWKALAYNPSSVPAMLILVYIELVQGNKEGALALMKREKRVQ
ncbi:hypothetical protein BSKO_00139 [Bryopsis sp. KO-2023]|nr:hypothetical protein BSKO_00139 [Bryopsis sp. KO-2023]